MSVPPAKTRISRSIRPVGSESSLSTWWKLGSLATHWAHSEDSDQTGWMSRLIWVFAGRTVTLFVLSCRGSNGTCCSSVHTGADLWRRARTGLPCPHTDCECWVIWLKDCSNPRKPSYTHIMYHKCYLLRSKIHLCEYYEQLTYMM